MRIYPKLNEFFSIVNAVETADVENRPIKTMYDYLYRILAINPRILGHYITRTTAITSFDWEIVGETNIIENTLLRCKNTIQQIIKDHTNTPFYGSSLYELDIINNQNNTLVYIKNIIPHQNYDYDLHYIYFYENGKYSHKVSINEGLYILDTYYIKGGILRSIMPLEIIRLDMILENANYLRKLKGLLQIVNKGGANPEAEASAFEAATNAINNNFFISDDMIELRLNQIAGQGGSNFKEFIDMINKDISIAILGQANTSELPNNGGSRAAVQVLHLISKDIAYSDMARIENVINQYLLIDYRMNYDLNAVKSPLKFRFIYEEEEDIEKNASALEILNRFLPIKKSEAYRFVKFTPPSDNDDILHPKQGLL